MRRALPHFWTVLLSAATALTVGAAAYAVPGPATPIPQGPNAEAPAAYLGAPAQARPIHRGSFAPRHPFMAPNGRSNLHDDAYQSDAGTTPGPLGRDPEVLSNFFAEECASHTFDREGRLVTVCVGLAEVTLRMLDPTTLDVLAEYSLPPRQPSSTPFSSFGGGGYFYLDQRDRVVVPTSQGTIDVIREAGTADAPTFELARRYDVSSAVGGSLILSALPDWHGRLWFVTGSGVVGVVGRHSGAVHSVDLKEPIGNSFAVDETGGVLVVSDAALYRFHARHGKPTVTWRRTYDHGDRQKPGQTQVGSGTTPTVVVRGHRRYVAITDNADPRMHVLVYRIGHRRPICRMPVFGKSRSDTDNSLIAFGRSLVVENNYGYTGPQEQPPAPTPERQTPTTRPGVTRVVVDYRHGGCRKAWTARVRVPTSVSKASTATGLVYVYEHPAVDEISYPDGEPLTGPQDPWYLTALDARTGERRWSVRTGVGLGYNNNYAPITLGPDGTAYVGVLGGILAVRDTR
jgi:outer membrane protein assembly factor BamB